MNFEWNEDLLMVRESVARLGQNVLKHRAEINDRADLPFDSEPLKELGLDSLSWDREERLMTTIALLELARWDVTSTLACLDSILGSVLGGASGLGFLAPVWEVTSFFGKSEFAYGDGVFWKVLSRSEELGGSLGIRGAQPRRAHAELEPIGENSDAQGALQIGLAAAFVGVARAALQAGHAYSMERIQFGKRIADFQGTQFKLAEMAARVEASELLVLFAAENPAFAASSLALAQDACLYVSDEAVQLHGGYGYTSEYEVERHFRDARFLSTLVS